MVDCMVATTTPAAKAESLAANLLAADYRGHFSHGLNRLAHYVKGHTYILCFMAVYSYIQGSDFAPFRSISHVSRISNPATAIPLRSRQC